MGEYAIRTSDNEEIKRPRPIHCAACRADDARKNYHVSNDELVVCARLRSRVPQWYEREPGYFWRSFKPQAPTQWWPRVGSRIGPSGGCVRPDYREGFALYTATQAQLLAELKRQSERLA